VILRIALALAFFASAFALGVAVGQALRDNPRPGGTLTISRTFDPLGRTATRTVTVTAP